MASEHMMQMFETSFLKQFGKLPVKNMLTGLSVPIVEFCECVWSHSNAQMYTKEMLPINVMAAPFLRMVHQGRQLVPAWFRNNKSVCI